MMAAPPLKTQRTCSQCGNNGHNARTCTDHTANSNNNTTGFMLFGVRLTADNNGGSPKSTANSLSPLTSSSCGFRKSVSMNNLSQYEHQPHQYDMNSGHNVPDGYASDDAVHASGSRGRERKRGVPWTEDEHKLFLVGLNKVGKGDWRGISRNYVKTRTPTQVASHAQKYFLRRTNINRRRRRSSLFDITTDAVTNSSTEDHQSFSQDSISQSKPPTPSNLNGKTISNIPKPFTTTAMLPTSTQARQVKFPLVPFPPSTNMANLNLNQSPSSSSTSTHSSSGQRDQSEPFLSLKLSSQPSDDESMSRASAFGGFNSSGDSICVA